MQPAGILSGISLDEKGFNTASGKYCCNFTKKEAELLAKVVSIPQAVSTVATPMPWVGLMYPTVSIPQAVSTVATGSYHGCRFLLVVDVSIPQAVSTVATMAAGDWRHVDFWSFNTASGKYCCNSYGVLFFFLILLCFNTASGKYCCN